MSSDIRDMIAKEEPNEPKPHKEALQPGIYPGTIVWSEKKMGRHNVAGVQQSSFLVKITGPPLNNNQMHELYRAARTYHNKRKQAAQALKAEQKQPKDAEAARKKEDLRRFHRKTFVPACVNVYIKARYRAHQDAQKMAQEAAIEVDNEDDDAEGNPDDGDYIERPRGAVGQFVLPRRSKRVRYDSRRI
jgi:hypothetical protein